MGYLISYRIFVYLRGRPTLLLLRLVRLGRERRRLGRLRVRLRRRRPPLIGVCDRENGLLRLTGDRVGLRECIRSLYSILVRILLSPCPRIAPISASVLVSMCASAKSSGKGITCSFRIRYFPTLSSMLKVCSPFLTKNVSPTLLGPIRTLTILNIYSMVLPSTNSAS